MKIELKYNEGQEVWYILNNKIKSTDLYHGFKVKCIYSGYSSEWGGKAFPIQVEYLVEKAFSPEHDLWISESKLFKTKQELIDTL